MNPYYATGFISALYFWVWPAFLYHTLDAHWLTVAFFSALIFFGAGRAASDLHTRFIAPKHPPRGRLSAIAVICFAIFALAWLTRIAYAAYDGAQASDPVGSHGSLYLSNLPHLFTA